MYNSGKTEVDTDLSKIIGEIIGKIQEIREDKTIEAGFGLEKGCFPGTMTAIELGVQAIVDQGQDLEPVQIETE